MHLYTALWALLFVIPGIVKMYFYSMTRYILAENPEIGISNAIDLSQDITYGHKIELFEMDLSFLLWNVAPILTLSLVGLYSIPYQEAIWSERYLFLVDIRSTFSDVSM